jgi:hypothetical protein
VAEQVAHGIAGGVDCPRREAPVPGDGRREPPAVQPHRLAAGVDKQVDGGQLIGVDPRHRYPYLAEQAANRVELGITGAAEQQDARLRRLAGGSRSARDLVALAQSWLTLSWLTLSWLTLSWLTLSWAQVQDVPGRG